MAVYAVTGSASGMGAAVVARLVAAGHRVVTVDLRDADVVADADEKKAALEAMKPFAALYMGGMGAKEQNFHNQVFERMGYAELAGQVQALYLTGEKEKATALIPDELVDDLHIIGTEAEVRDKVAQWEETGVTTLLLSLGSAADVHRIAEVLG